MGACSSSGSRERARGRRRWRLLGSRAASTVEYAVVLVAVLLVAAGSYKLLGSTLSKRSSVAGDAVAGSDGPGGGSGGGNGGGGAGIGKVKASGGAAGGGGGGDRSTVAAKMSMGGAKGAGGESGGAVGAAGHDDATRAGGESGATGSVGGAGEVAEGFTTKRWFAIGLLALGLLGIGYVVFSARRAKTPAAAAARGRGAGRLR